MRKQSLCDFMWQLLCCVEVDFDDERSRFMKKPTGFFDRPRGVITCSAVFENNNLHPQYFPSLAHLTRKRLFGSECLSEISEKTEDSLTNSMNESYQSNAN